MKKLFFLFLFVLLFFIPKTAIFSSTETLTQSAARDRFQIEVTEREKLLALLCKNCKIHKNKKKKRPQNVLNKILGMNTAESCIN